MFSEDQRAIFAYDSGAGIRYADPLAIFRELTIALDGDLAGALAATRPSEEEGEGEDMPARTISRAMAEGKLIKAVREAFALPPLNTETGEGASDTVAWRAFNCYLEWCEGNAHGGERSLT